MSALSHTSTAEPRPKPESTNTSIRSRGQASMLRWCASLGAITAPALALRDGRSAASARGLLAAAERAGLMRRSSLLADCPALYTITSAGLRSCGLHGLAPSQVGVAGARHAAACAHVAAVLERAYPDRGLMGERELRLEQCRSGVALASATLGRGPNDAPLLHRPDLALWPLGTDGQRPIAVEVELTVKADERLRRICVAWARCRQVEGVLYVAAPRVLRPLTRAVARAQAERTIAVLRLEDLIAPSPAPAGGPENRPKQRLA